MTVFKGYGLGVFVVYGLQFTVYGLQNPTYVLCRKFFKSLLFFWGGETWGDVLP